MVEEFTFTLYGDKYTVDEVLEERGIKVDPDNDKIMSVRDEIIGQLECVEFDYGVDFERGIFTPLAVYINGVEFRSVAL